MIGCTDYQGEIESAHEEFLDERSASNCACVTDAGGQIIKGGRIYWKLNCHGDRPTDFIDIYDTLDATHSLGDYHQDGPDRFYLEMTNELSGSLEFVTPYIDVVRAGKYSMTFKCVTVRISDEDYYNSSSSFTPLSSSSAKSSSSARKSNACGDLWCGPKDTEGRVKTGFGDDMSGWWFSYTDKFDDGNSEIIFPNDVNANEYGNFFGPLTEEYKGIRADIKLRDGFEYPYAGFGFNIVDDLSTGADISDWEGLCLVYKSGKSFNIQLAVENDSKVTENNNYSVTVPASTSLVISDFDWSRFKQAGGWGKKVQLDDVLQKTASINFHFSGVGSAEFFLQSIGKYGTCK